MFFSKYLDNYCRYQYCANDTLFRNISSILQSIFQDILTKIDVAFCETTDTAHSYIKQIVNFSEINVSICHGAFALPCICKRRGFLCRGSCILDLYLGTDRQRLLLMMMVFIYIADTSRSRHDTGHLEIYIKIT